MIKNLKRSDIQNTPFVATKPWVLTSFQNDDLVIIEEIPQEIPVAQEFIDYEGGDDLPIINRECNIALEQQTPDQILYEEGEKINGLFNPDGDPKNNTGTFKRLVYNQVKNAFYNQWNDPTKIFGMENIDFHLSETQKFLSDKFRVFTISNKFFGEKMLENSILLVDNALDDNFRIVDDGKSNIFARENLFSKIQEVRKFYNKVNPSITSTFCDYYYQDISSRQAGTQGGTSGTSGTSGTGGYYGTAGTHGYLPPINCQPW
jgi:hypothetical protein